MRSVNERDGTMAKEKDQAALIRTARKRLDITTEELADLLGKSLPTVRSWLVPKGKSRRNMPESSRLLLARILAEHKASMRGGK